MTIRMDKLATIERHDFLVSPRDKKLGLYVNGVGTRIAPPHTPYQVFEEGSPYQWQHGRTLFDHALVYLTEGGGVFRLRGKKQQRVQAGDMLLLRPGVWHDYFPDLKTGWREYWVVFNGTHAAPLLAPLGPPKRTPVLRVGIDGALCRLFNEMLDAARENPPFLNTLSSGILLQLLSIILGRGQMGEKSGRQEYSLVHQAKQHMETHYAGQIDMQALAKSFHISYRHFRRMFKISTGMAPHQYLLSLRILHARRFLEEQNIKISTLAGLVGFDDAYYFSRIFKHKTGIPPAHWRT